MYAQKIGPAPELHDDLNPQAPIRPDPGLLVQYPRSAPFTVTLSQPGLWNEIAGARAAHLSAGEVPGVPGLVSEPGGLLSWIAVGTGLAFVAGLWAAILF